MKKSQQIILDIVPLTKIPLSRNQSFSYLSEKKLGEGTIVSIPLFKRKIEGIVAKNRPDFPRLGNIELKKIDRVIEENFLNEKQLKLAHFISDYYISPLGIVFKSFVPKRVKQRKNKSEQLSVSKKARIELTEEQSKAANEITSIKSKTPNTKYYLYGPAGSGKTEIYINAISQLMVRDPELQFLILLPELTLTPQAVERYGAYFKIEKIAVLHSKVSKGQFYSAWKKIKSGEVKIIIGSRMAVFAPFKKLGLIIIDEEQDLSFKQWDMNPRYDARNVADKLAFFYNAKIVFGSATPSIEVFHRAINEEIKLLEIPALSLPHQQNPREPEVTLVDLRKERWQKNYSSISKKLLSEIGYALKNHLQVILFVNRQGMSRYSVCMTCKSILKCPQCDRALIYDQTGVYKCIYCAYNSSITPRCPECKGLKFTNIGIGTQKVEREIADLFPKAKIMRVDAQTMKSSGSQEKMYQDFTQKKADILIGTQMISKGWDLPSVAVIGIIDADSLLSMPDFGANIKAYQDMVQISGRTGRLGAKYPGSVIIQTFNPDHFIIKAASERDFYTVFKKDIEERREIKLPPFCKIVKIIFQDYNLNKVKEETQKIFISLVEKKIKNIKIYKPHEALASKIRGRFRKQIIIKINSKEMELPKEIKNSLSLLPNGWIIDVDPITIN